MASGTTTSNAFISDITGHCVAGDATFGSNGDAGGTGEEVFVGHDPADAVATRRVWDPSPSDGIDSGWVLVSLTASAGGGTAGVSWSVDGATDDPVTYTGVTYGTVGTVRVRAGVRLPARVRWRNLVVRWIRSGRVMETFTLASGPEVDTRTSGSAAEAEQILEVTPSAGTHQKVVVDAEVSFAAPEGVEPGPNDLFAQIFVNAANCTQV